MQDKSELLNRREVATILGCSPRQVYNLEQRKVIERHPAFIHPRFRRDDVKKFIEGGGL